MKESTITVTGLTRAQANALAEIFVNGQVTSLLSKELKKAGHPPDEQILSDASAMLDDRPYKVNHEITF